MIEAIDALRQTFFATSPGSALSCGIRRMEYAVGVPAPAESRTLNRANTWAKRGISP